MVTHNPELGELTDRVIYLHHGKFGKRKFMKNKFVKLLAISAVIFVAFLVKMRGAAIGQKAPTWTSPPMDLQR